MNLAFFSLKVYGIFFSDLIIPPICSPPGSIYESSPWSCYDIIGDAIGKKRTEKNNLTGQRVFRQKF